MSKRKTNLPLKKQFKEGAEAFKIGNLECPYLLGSILQKEWQRGFDTAYFDHYWSRRVEPYISMYSINEQTVSKIVHG